MEKGNKLAGFEFNKGYYAIWLYPIGFELFNHSEMDLCEIGLVLHPFSISLCFKSNFTLFRDQ